MSPTLFPPTCGAVLTGGDSTRMGRDKALIQIDAVPMVQRVARALRAAGADPVMAIGGDRERLRAIGLRVEPDRFPGLGPLGGLATALRAADGRPVLLAPCDLIDPSADAFRAILLAVEAAADPDVVLASSPDASGRQQSNFVMGWWHSRTLAVVEQSVREGRLAMRDALDLLSVATVHVAASVTQDADTPDDLPAGADEED